MAFLQQPFGTAADGGEVQKYTLENRQCSVSVLSRGAALQSVVLKTPAGPLDVLLGCDTVQDYEAQDSYFGAFVGRVANRIAKGRFSLAGREYVLACNNGENHLHGGLDGFDRRCFALKDHTSDSFTLALVSQAGDQGYPGEVRLEVCYQLTESTLRLSWQAAADEATLFGPTSHAYWNLAGQGSGDVLGQYLQLCAAAYTPVDGGLIPTGEVRTVAGSPFDFTAEKRIGRDIDQPDDQLKAGGGYDHNFAVEGPSGTLRLAARARCQETGVGFTLRSTLPGVQFYSGNAIPSGTRGKGGAVYGARSGFCLEPQYYPDAVHHEGFEKNLLLPGETQQHTIEWAFSVQ